MGARDLYFWYMIAESQPGRAVYYSPRDQGDDPHHMGLEAAFHSCLQEDCVIGVAGDTDGETIKVLQVVCERRVRSEMYRNLNVGVISPGAILADHGGGI